MNCFNNKKELYNWNTEALQGKETVWELQRPYLYSHISYLSHIQQ